MPPRGRRQAAVATSTSSRISAQSSLARRATRRRRRHGYTGSPLVDGQRIIVGVGGRHGASVVCFDKTNGKVLWKSQDDIPGYSGPVLATLAGVRQVVSFTSDGLIGLDAENGKLLWRTAVKTVFQPPRHHARGLSATWSSSRRTRPDCWAFASRRQAPA